MQKPASDHWTYEDYLRLPDDGTRCEIIEGESWQLRYPVGPLAPIALAWRARNSDEEWIAMLSGTDAEWTAMIKREFGIEIAL